MLEHTRKTTSAEVWSVIKARHGDDLVVFSSFSAPEGDYQGNPDEGRMMTEYGFENAPYPLIGADTRWDIDREKPHERINMHTDYWLCIALDAPD